MVRDALVSARKETEQTLIRLQESRLTVLRVESLGWSSVCLVLFLAVLVRGCVRRLTFASGSSWRAKGKDHPKVCLLLLRVQAPLEGVDTVGQ